MSPELRAELMKELEAEKAAAEFGKIQIESIRPGMSEADWAKAAAETLAALAALKEGN